MKVWIYKGDILPYKTQAEDKISREAAMAVGEASGTQKPRAVVSSAAAPRQGDLERVDEAEEPAPLIKEADPEFEKLLEEEEDILRSTREHSETPHFRPGDAD